ncbi:MAG: hypothetical protein M1838_003054 [Thelocarpon superellum]|nr:MAG: hypothetical protein M1838_003054 [Thelocarpon superellum]
MPYNTRRKSLSLPSLGIHLPPNSRALPANRSPPSLNTTTAASTSSTAAATTTTSVARELPPSKKVKRSHASSPSPPTKIKVERAHASPIFEDTPPPSPRPSVDVRIDTDGINDEIVTGVIRQLEKTGNKPQLVKELAAVLCDSSRIVESSANPQAIISSRLNAYLRRPWTALAPCPIAKTLIATHPRRIFFYLTTVPHQPLPLSSSDSPLPSNRRSAVISPSLTSDEDSEARRRAALSPSPEVDLSVPEMDEADIPPTPAGSYSGRSSLARDGSHSIVGAGEGTGHLHRAASPPLEGDEKEFTHTASVMQSKRSMSLDYAYATSVPPNGDVVMMSTEDETGEGRVPSGPVEESEESAHARNSETAAALFGHSQLGAAASLSSPLVRPTTHLHLTTSPMQLRKTVGALDRMMDVDDKTLPDGESTLGLGWGHEMLSPEKVDLDELDDLLGDL